MNITLSYIMKKPTCDRCDREFASEQGLDYHKKNNVCNKELEPIITDKIYECRLCEKHFTTKQHLDYHEDNLVCILQNKTCYFCLKTLSSLRRFKQHWDKCKIRKKACHSFI